MNILSRLERFAMFLDALAAAPPAASHDEAFQQIADTLNTIEEAHYGVPMNPARFMDDGRLYPPQPDSRRAVAGRDDLIRYRARSHNVFIGSNGAIRIDALASERSDPACCLSKPGADGRMMEF